ncbi:hypothetical protein M3Y94_00483600 [Aphelenchoides besseyi]|nr:hypothetical protein M3Y94_00483600 [Aphelenchoides besseyi]
MVECALISIAKKRCCERPEEEDDEYHTAPEPPEEESSERAGDNIEMQPLGANNSNDVHNSLPNSNFPMTSLPLQTPQFSGQNSTFDSGVYMDSSFNTPPRKRRKQRRTCSKSPVVWGC